MNTFLYCLLMSTVYFPVQDPAKTVEQPPTQEALEFTTTTNFVQDPAKPPASLEQAITQALVSHPDMRLAEAELRVAEAKLAQARIVVSQKVTEEFHRLEKERADVAVASGNWQRISQLKQKNMVSKQEADEAQHLFARAKARMATTESSWKLMMGNQFIRNEQSETVALSLRTYLNPQGQENYKSALLPFYRFNVQPSFEVYRTIRDNSDTVTTNSIEHLKTKLETKVKLDKQTNIDLEQAFQKVTDGAGVKVRVKLPITENKIMYREVTRLDLDASEYPLHTWLQLIVDEMNTYQVMSAPQRKETPKRFELYVREYGLLLTSHDLAPPDAITVQELWKQAQFEKAAKEAKKNAAPKK